MERRNKHFYDIINYCENNSISIAVNILESNLEEQEAYQFSRRRRIKV